MDYLRKEGTNMVYPRTRILAKRSDMIAISEEEAEECKAAQKEGNKKKAAKLQSDGKKKAELPPQAKEATGAKNDEPKLADMDRDALVKLAKKEKIYVNKNMTEESIREKIAETTGRE